MRWNSIREFADEAQIRLRTHREELDRSNKTTQAKDGSTPEIVRASLRPIVAIAIPRRVALDPEGGSIEIGG